MKTLTLNTTTPTTTVTNSTSKTIEHLSLNRAGSIRVFVEGKDGKEGIGRRMCSCNTCSHCNTHNNPTNYVRVEFGIQSYNAHVNSDRETIIFPSTEAFKEFAQFISKVDVDAMFKEQAPITKAAA